MSDNIESNPETGDYWDCPHCWWEGPDAEIDMDEWVMRCPECDEVIDKRLREILDGERTLETD